MTLRKDVEARIEATAPEGLFREVEGASSLDEIINGRTHAPGCYVIRLSLNVAENRSGSGVVQAYREGVGVVFVGDTTGRAEDVSDEVESWSDLVRGALLNWIPPGAGRGLECGHGRYLTTKNNNYFWQDNYFLSGQQFRQVNTNA